MARKFKFKSWYGRATNSCPLSLMGLSVRRWSPSRNMIAALGYSRQPQSDAIKRICFSHIHRFFKSVFYSPSLYARKVASLLSVLNSLQVVSFLCWTHSGKWCHKIWDTTINALMVQGAPHTTGCTVLGPNSCAVGTCGLQIICHFTHLDTLSSLKCTLQLMIWTYFELVELASLCLQPFQGHVRWSSLEELQPNRNPWSSLRLSKRHSDLSMSVQSY